MKIAICRKVFLPLALSCAVLVACAPTPPQQFNRVTGPALGVSYVAVGADFSKYDRLAADDMGIFFPAHAVPSESDQQRVRDIFRDAFLEQLIGYEIVRDRRGPTTLLVQASLIDFTEATDADMMSLNRQVRDFASPGSIIFLMELRDSMSGRVLARAGDSARIPSFRAGDDIPTNWDAVDLAAQRWARLFREFLDNNLGK